MKKWEMSNKNVHSVAYCTFFIHVMRCACSCCALVLMYKFVVVILMMTKMMGRLYGWIPFCSLSNIFGFVTINNKRVLFIEYLFPLLWHELCICVSWFRAKQKKKNWKWKRMQLWKFTVPLKIFIECQSSILQLLLLVAFIAFNTFIGWMAGWLVGWIDAELRMHVFYRIYNYFYVITKHFVMTVFITMLSDHLLMFEYDTRERRKKNK